MYSFYCHQNNGEKIGLSLILSIIHTATIVTMLNLSVDKNGHRLKNVTCKQTLIDSPTLPRCNLWFDASSNSSLAKVRTSEKSIVFIWSFTVFPPRHHTQGMSKTSAMINCFIKANLLRSDKCG